MDSNTISNVTNKNILQEIPSTVHQSGKTGADCGTYEEKIQFAKSSADQICKNFLMVNNCLQNTLSYLEDAQQSINNACDHAEGIVYDKFDNNIIEKFAEDISLTYDLIDEQIDTINKYVESLTIEREAQKKFDELVTKNLKYNGPGKAQKHETGNDMGSHTHETCMQNTSQLNSRMMTMTSGMTAFSSQMAIPACYGYGADFSCAENLLPPCDDPTIPGPGVNRYVLLAQYTWEQSLNPGTLLAKQSYPQDLITASPENLFAATCKRHKLVRSGYSVIVSCNPSRFHQGNLLAVLIPEAEKETMDGNPILNVNQLTLYPHQFLNLRSTDAVCLNVPFVSPNPIDIVDTHNNWTLVLVVISPLLVAAETPQQSLIVKTLVAPINPSFHGLLETRALYNAPPIQISNNVGACSTVGSNMTSQTLQQSLEEDMPITYLPPPVQSLLEMIRIPTMLTTNTGFGFNWTTATASGDKLFSVPVTLNPDEEPFEGTYLADLSSLFSQWNGTIDLDFMFSGTINHQGRLCVCFTPNTQYSLDVTMASAMESTYCIWDIGSNSTLHFPIPYIAQTHWRNVYSTSMATSLTSYIGQIDVFVYNPLTGPSNVPTTCNVVTFASGNSDFSLRLPSINPFNYNAGEESSDELVQLEAGEISQTKPSGMWEGAATTTPESSKDTDVTSFYSRSRFYSIVNLPGSSATPGDPVAAALPLTCLSKRGNRQTLQAVLDSLFTYFKADVRVLGNLQAVESNAISDATGTVETRSQLQSGTAGQWPNAGYVENAGAIKNLSQPEKYTNTGTFNFTAAQTQSQSVYQVTMSNVPPGGNFKAALTASIHNLQSAMPTMYSSMGVNTSNQSVYIPYQSPYNVLPAFYDGYSSADKTVYGQLNNNVFGTLLISYSAPQDVDMAIYTSYHNLSAFLPRPFPTHAHRALKNQVLDVIHIQPVRGLAYNGNEQDEEIVHPECLRHDHPNVDLIDIMDCGWEQSQVSWTLEDLEDAESEFWDGYPFEYECDAIPVMNVVSNDEPWYFESPINSDCEDDDDCEIDGPIPKENLLKYNGPCLAKNKISAKFECTVDVLDGKKSKPEEIEYNSNDVFIPESYILDLHMIPGHTFVSKYNRDTYVHWAISNGGHDISLSQSGFDTVVAMTEAQEGRIVHKMIPDSCWIHALEMVSTKFLNYSATNNCTHFCELISGESLQNTGSYLIAGMLIGAAAACTTVGLLCYNGSEKTQTGTCVTPKSTFHHSSEPTWEMERAFDPPSTSITPKAFIVPRPILPIHNAGYYRALRAMAFKQHDIIFNKDMTMRQIHKALQYNAPTKKGMVEHIEEAAASIKDAGISASCLSDKLDTLLTPDLVKDFKETIKGIKQASLDSSATLNAVQTAIATTTQTLQAGFNSVVASVAQTVISYVCKIVGWTLMIFCNPCPGIIGSLVLLLSAEVIGNPALYQKIMSGATSLKEKFLSCVEHVAGIPAGILDPKTCPPLNPEEIQAAQEAEQVQFVDEKLLGQTHKLQHNAGDGKILTAAKDFNTFSTTARNIDWIINKVKELIDWLLQRFTNYRKETPEYKLSQKHDEIVTMYRNAIYAGDIQNVDEEAVKKETEIARDLFSQAIACKNTTYISMLRETIKLNLDILRKIKNTKFSARAEPVVCLFWGKPGCGKSVACNKLARLACEERGLNPENHIFSMPPKSEYFDGYTGQFCHVIDDLGNDSTGTDYDCFLQMVSTCPFKPALADLKEKGITYQSEIIYASSNFRDACPPTVRSHEAIERRIFAKCEVILNDKFAIEPSVDDKKYKKPVLDFAHANANCGPAPTPYDEYFMYDTAIMNGDAFVCKVSIAGGATKMMNLYQVQHLIDEEHARRQRQATAADDVFRSSHGHSAKPRLSVSRKFTKDDFEIKNIVSGLNLGMGTAAEAADATNPNNPRLHHNGNKDEVPTSVINHSAAQNQKEFEEMCVKARYVNPADSAVLKTNPEVLKLAADTNTDTSVLREMAAKLDKTNKITIWCTILGALAGLIGLVCWFFTSRKTKTNGAYANVPGLLTTKTVAKTPLAATGLKYNMKLPQIYNKVERNIFPITAHFENANDSTLSCIGIADRVYAINFHNIKGAREITLRGIRFSALDAKASRVIHDCCKSDLCFITAPKETPSVPDIRKYLLSQDTDISASKGLLMVRTDKKLIDMLATNIKPIGMETIDGIVEPNCFSYSCLATFGHCGGPILACQSNREFIAGFHIASDSNGYSIGTRITREDVEKYINAKPTIEDSLVIPSYNGLRLETATPVKPVFAFTKTALAPSPAAGAFPATKQPAVLHASDKRLNTCLSGEERKQQFEDGVFGKLSRNMTTPWKNMTASADLYIEKLKQLIPERLAPISQHEAINGIEGLDGLDMNQSPGYPYTTEGISRRSLFTLTPEGYEPKERLQNDIDAALNDPSSFYFTSFLKDELRTNEKVANGATRVVEGDSLPRIIAMRMVFGRFFALFNMNPGFKTGSAVGCDPDFHWTQWYHELAKKSNVYDLDYKNFDGSLPTCAFDVLSYVLSKFIDLEDTEIKKFVDSIANSYHVWGGKLYNHVGGMPSGCVGTSIFNSILNNIFVQSAFISINPDYVPDEVLILTYGDDVVYGTNQKLLPQEISHFYKYNTTLTVTPGNKLSDWKEKSSIHDVTFLKRWFVPDPEHRYLIHPIIDPSVYEQSAMWVRGGDFQDTLTSLCQLAFHSGPRNYDAWVKAVRAQIQKNTHSCRFSFLPFSFLQSRWLAKFNTQ
ncbi:polyprotein [pemapivirus A1]|uniref:Genome polyprotein n=1 Tax=pemapivirus A1 TaxID=2870356 RepID=A0ABM6TBI8_9PICO|nr:polyprotein [pemapivirus A1]AVM87457.1 polyprotein [pemapivirus A1]